MGDKAGKLLAWLDRLEIADRWVTEINSLDGVPPQHKESIAERFASYYTKIYSSETDKMAEDSCDLLARFHLPTLKRTIL